MATLRELILNRVSGEYTLLHSEYREPIKNLSLIGSPRAIRYQMISCEGGDIIFDKKKRITEAPPSEANAFHVGRDVQDEKITDYICEVQYVHVDEKELKVADEVDARILTQTIEFLEKLSS